MGKTGHTSGSDSSRRHRVIFVFSVVNLGLVVAFLILLFGVSEHFFLGALFCFAPRIFALIPSLILLPLSLVWARNAVILNAVTAILILTVAMEFNIPDRGKEKIEDSGNQQPLRILSCNVQRMEPDFSAVLAEITSIKPDLIVFQEARDKKYKPPPLSEVFPDWHVCVENEYQVASRYPARVVDHLTTSGFNRVSIVAFEIDHPDGQLVLFNFHPKSVQNGLKHLDLRTSGSLKAAFGKFDLHQSRRQSEHDESRQFVKKNRQGRPIIIAGDFNAPVSSSLFQEFWGEFNNTFTAAGWGYGYTAPCDGPGWMPSGLPWIRIDHILVDDEWHVENSNVGKSNGSDHRIVWADLRRKNPSE